MTLLEVKQMEIKEERNPLQNARSQLGRQVIKNNGGLGVVDEPAALASQEGENLRAAAS